MYQRHRGICTRKNLDIGNASWEMEGLFVNGEMFVGRIGGRTAA